jgi:hypothetical protein
MTRSGRISVLVSRDLGVLTQAIAQAEPEMRTQIRRFTKPMAEEAWAEELRGGSTTRLEVRVLADTARVAVSDQNVMLKSATVGRVGKVPASVLAPGAEFGADPQKVIKSQSKAGKPYTRRRGQQFRAPRRRGYVVFPAVGQIVPRIASLWMQTAIRTFAEKVEGAARG